MIIDKDEFTERLNVLFDLHRSRYDYDGIRPERHFRVVQSYYRGEFGDHIDNQADLIEAMWPEMEDIFGRYSHSYKDFSIGEGWWRIVIDLNGWLRNIDPNYQIAQIKEKFGTLRYYHEIPYKDEDNPLIELCRPLTSYTEGLSSWTCEICGDRGTNRTGGWYKTRCDPCHAVYEIAVAKEQERYAARQLEKVVAKQKDADATPRDCC